MSVKKLALETAVYGLSSIVGRLLNVLLVPFYTRVLTSTAEYGVVVDLYALSAFVMVVLSYRMEAAFFRFGTPETDRERVYSTGMWSLLVSTAFVVALLLVFAPQLAAVLRYPDHPEYVRWFALILSLDCLAELPLARLRMEQRPLRFAAIRLTSIGVNIGMNLFWLLFCPWANQQGLNWVRALWSPEDPVSYIFLSNLVASAVALLLLWPQLRRIRLVFDAHQWQRMVAYSAPLVVVSFAGIVDEMFSRAMLKYLLPGSIEENLAQVGIFGANYKLAALISLFTQAYRYAAEPFFFRNAYAANALQNQARVTEWFTAAAAMGMLAILLFIDVIKYFIAPTYWSGLHVVPVLLMANVFLGIYYNFSAWYRLKDRTGLNAWLSIAGAVLTIGLNLWLIPRFGYYGAAWVTLICYVFMCVATWYLGFRHYPVPYPLGRMAAYLVGAWIFYLIHRLLKAALSVPSEVYLLLGAILWSLFVWGIFRWNKTTLQGQML
ncbi:MAG: polysaccharide biosynthesis C-terminal domain-containing protein [Saprospiraceae bacterium]|nr:polysaccharide biosynthesis C-terminal domain-containing protein [Saprospiraceae bacterium]MDW8485147.1 polysaccharide biosynthesis C-terminal domain-containing protein [Saprospiraceae bacterium]